MCVSRIVFDAFDRHETTINISGNVYNVYIINTFEHVSDLGDKLSQSSFAHESRSGKLCDFVIMWHYDHQHNKTSVSLRSDSSRESSTNVRQISEIFGGGGHRCAAGFSVPGCNNILDVISDKNRNNTNNTTSFIREYYSYLKQSVTPYWWVIPVVGLFFVSGKMSH